MHFNPQHFKVTKKKTEKEHKEKVREKCEVAVSFQNTLSFSKKLALNSFTK